jgi:hypothetical protein
MATKLMARMSSYFANADDREAADRDHHGSAAALKNAAGDEEANVTRNAAKK